MTCLYTSLFCPPTTTDEDKDLEIQNRYNKPYNLATWTMKIPHMFNECEIFTASPVLLSKPQCFTTAVSIMTSFLQDTAAELGECQTP
jgi:hypothetical protein